MNQTASVYLKRLDERERAAHAAKLFGPLYPKVESFIVDTAQRMSRDYQPGGPWHFYALGADGFYMAPISDTNFRVRFDTDEEHSLSPDAFGMAVCLSGLNLLQYSGPPGFPQACARSHRALLHHVLRHPERRAILRATY